MPAAPDEDYDDMPEWMRCPVGECGHRYCQHLIDAHPSLRECDIEECPICSVRDCPYHDDWHYDADGCPACLIMQVMIQSPDMESANATQECIHH